MNFCNKLFMLTGAIVVTAGRHAIRCCPAARRVVVGVVWCFRVAHGVGGWQAW
jgi:hypothetical protein